MVEYVPSPSEFVRDQVARYEQSDGADGAELNGQGVVIVTHRGRKSGAIRKTPVMRVVDGERYLLIGSMGGAPKDPEWAHNLREHPEIELRDRERVQAMRVHEAGGEERAQLWAVAVEAFPQYAEYQEQTERQIPVFVAEPAGA